MIKQTLPIATLHSGRVIPPAEHIAVRHNALVAIVDCCDRHLALVAARFPDAAAGILNHRLQLRSDLASLDLHFLPALPAPRPPQPRQRVNDASGCTGAAKVELTHSRGPDREEKWQTGIVGVIVMALSAGLWTGVAVLVKHLFA